MVRRRQVPQLHRKCEGSLVRQGGEKGIQQGQALQDAHSLWTAHKLVKQAIAQTALFNQNFAQAEFAMRYARG